MCGTESATASTALKSSRSCRALDLGISRQERIEAVESFLGFDRNGVGQVAWDDLLFAVTVHAGIRHNAVLWQQPRARGPRVSTVIVLWLAGHPPERDLRIRRAAAFQLDVRFSF